ncbi:MAG: CHASE2 domain-containing protein [Leptolyngbyaceae cyanobacterium SM2_5_2]|nr:CHASE2 domain-containing protein [Leptolyngbyaceae cyanobacterium SM2_5_2]
MVLIGVTRTDGYREYWNTPYNLPMGSQMAGVMLQAQMTSQLIDAALGESLLIWVLPFWGEWLWILLWSSVGGVIIWRLPLTPTRIGALVIALGAGYAICYVVFQTFYGWLPFIPVALVLGAAPLSNWLVDSGRLRLYKMRKKK